MRPVQTLAYASVPRLAGVQTSDARRGSNVTTYQVLTMIQTKSKLFNIPKKSGISS
jgi:hypothetical protein